MVVSIYENNVSRGIISNINESSPIYDIYYIDWGNFGLTDFASVDRPVEYWDLPGLSVPVVLEHWEKYDPEEGEKILDLLNELLKSNTVTNDVLFINGPNCKLALRDFINFNTNEALISQSYVLTSQDLKLLIENVNSQSN